MVLQLVHVIEASFVGLEGDPDKIYLREFLLEDFEAPEHKLCKAV